VRRECPEGEGRTAHCSQRLSGKLCNCRERVQLAAEVKKRLKRQCNNGVTSVKRKRNKA
jgi:hypothetical protein